MKRLFILMTIAFLISCKKKDSVTPSPTPVLATVVTTSINGITQTTAQAGGTVTSDGYTTVIARGYCWGTSQDPTISNNIITAGTGTGNFVGSLTGLIPNTNYHVRAYATNSAGTAYGSNISFTTLAAPGTTVTDIDGNVYNTVTIGTQIWMKENLRVSRYRNGDAIATWQNSSQPSTVGAYVLYDNNAMNNTRYGKLYNWYAVNDNRKLAPVGWHVATDAEWTTLITYLGGESVAGGKLKEAGTAHWKSPNTDATNASGFTALPGGYAYNNGSFTSADFYGYWWSATEDVAGSAWGRYLYYDAKDIRRWTNLEHGGMSVRCVKD